MKKFILFLLFSTSFAKTIISDTITVKSYVNPDIYFLPIKVSYISQSEENVLDVLGKLDKSIRTLKLKYKGGNFYIREYKDYDPNLKKYVSKGFIGEIIYNFYLKNIENQNRIFNLLNRFSKLYNIKYIVYNPHYIISNQKQNEILEKLKYKAINKIIFEKRKIEKLLNKSCEISYISFNSIYIPIFRSQIKFSKSLAPEPAKSSKEISLKVKVKFECK